MLDAVAADADTHGIDRQYVRTIFTEQIAATEGIEYTRFGQWKFDPATAPTTAPDLSESRSAIDEFNRTMVDEIALHWNSLHSPSCVTDLAGAIDAVVAQRRARWALSAGPVVGHPVLLPYLSSRDIRRSASTLPPV